MFIPDFFGIVNEKLIETFPENLDHDPEDLMDDKYLLEVHITYFDLCVCGVEGHFFRRSYSFRHLTNFYLTPKGLHSSLI